MMAWLETLKQKYWQLISAIRNKDEKQGGSLINHMT